MPTKRPRLSIDVHRYTDRVLRAYGETHGLSLSGLLVTGAFLLARMVEREVAFDPAGRNLPEKLHKDLVAAYPDYDPEVVIRSLQRELRSLGKTLAHVGAFDPPTLQPRQQPCLPRAVADLFDIPGSYEKAIADDKVAQSGLDHLYNELTTAMNEVNVIIRRPRVSAKQTGASNQSQVTVAALNKISRQKRVGLAGKSSANTRGKSSDSK